MTQQPIPDDLARMLVPIKAQIADAIGRAELVINAYFTGKGVQGARVDLDRMLVELPDEEAPRG